jgi:hypothetical protein
VATNRFAKASVTIAVVENSFPIVSCSVNDNSFKLNPNYQIVINGQISMDKPTQGVCAWSLNQNSGMALESVALLPYSVIVSASSYLNMIIAPNSFVLGSSLMFTLSCKMDNGKSVFSTTTITVNNIFTIQANKGEMTETLARVAPASEDMPLTSIACTIKGIHDDDNVGEGANDILLKSKELVHSLDSMSFSSIDFSLNYSSSHENDSIERAYLEFLEEDDDDNLLSESSSIDQFEINVDCVEENT